MIKIACSTGVRSTESLDVACGMIAEMGFRYVDPLAMEQWHVKPSRLVSDAAGEAEHVRAVVDRYGLACVAINLAFVSNFTTCTDAEHLVNLKVLEGACLLAGTLGTSILTVSPGGMGDEDRQTILDRISVRLNEALTIGAREGMTLALEPKLVVAGRFSAGMESVVEVTASGARLISRVPVDVFVKKIH